MNKELKTKIINDFGLNGVAEVEQEEMIEKIGNLLFEAVIERSVDELDQAKMTEFEEVIAKAEGNYADVISFLKTRVPDFTNIVAEEMTRLKKATSAIFA